MKEYIICASPFTCDERFHAPNSFPGFVLVIFDDVAVFVNARAQDLHDLLRTGVKDGVPSAKLKLR